MAYDSRSPYSSGGSYGVLNGGRVIGPAESSSRLLSKVMGLVGAAFALTAAGSYVSLSIPPGIALMVMLLNFGTLFAISATRANPARQVTLLYAFAFLEGIGLGPTIQHYLHHGGIPLVEHAALTTAIGMAMLGTIAYAVSVDYRKLQSIGTFFLIGVIVMSLAAMFFHFVQPTTIDYLILAVFSLLTVADFARVRAGGGGATSVELALAIFLDGLNIFLAVLNIFGNRSND